MWIFFWDEPFLSRLYEIYLSIKDSDNLAEFNLLQNLHLCTQKFVCATNFGSLGEIGANFSLQLSSRTQFVKINYKKVIAKNQCEKHKKSSLVCVICNSNKSFHSFLFKLYIMIVHILKMCTFCFVHISWIFSHFWGGLDLDIFSVRNAYGVPSLCNL